MSAPVADAASQGGASHQGKKRKLDGELPSVWVGGYDKAEADRLLAELKAKLARARADAKAAALQGAEEVAALKAKLDRVQSLAARYQRERDTARAERDAASSERDARAQERDEGAKEFAAQLERCKASAKEAAAQAEQKRLALAKELKDVTKERDDMHEDYHGMKTMYNDAADKYNRCADHLDAIVEERDSFRKKYNEFTKEFNGMVDELQRCKASAKEAAAQAEQKYDALATIRQDLQERYKKWKKSSDAYREELTEAREQSKTARELGRREAAADLAAAKARADNAVKSLQDELAKSKSLEDELELVKAQRDTAKKRLAQVAEFQRKQVEFQRKQVEMQRMLMSQSFMNLEDGAAASPSAGPSVTMGSVIDGPSPYSASAERNFMVASQIDSLLQVLNSNKVENVD